jgi:dehydrogenase/reductase SDR family protein 1
MKISFQIRSHGGQCIPICVDHEKDDEIEGLFQRIAKEQDGRLDILINNAFKAATVRKKTFD